MICNPVTKFIPVTLKGNQVLSDASPVSLASKKRPARKQLGIGSRGGALEEDDGHKGK